MKYGNLLRSTRVSKEITLRELAKVTDIDVAYLSRVERGTIPPPQKQELLQSINDGLKLTVDEALMFNDFASLDNKQFPKDIEKNITNNVGIPMLLRTVANKKLSPDKIKEISDYINKEY